MCDKKTKVLNIRLSVSDYDLIASAAFRKRRTSSSLVRSLALTAITEDFNISPSSPSPSPALDQLSFEARFELLRVLDVLVGSMIASGFSVSEVETELLPKLNFTNPTLLQDLFEGVKNECNV